MYVCFDGDLVIDKHVFTYRILMQGDKSYYQISL
jgi:hypothetical protein